MHYYVPTNFNPTQVQINQFVAGNKEDFDRFVQETFFVSETPITQAQNQSLKRTFYFWKTVSRVMAKTPLSEDRGRAYSRVATGYETIYEPLSFVNGVGKIVSGFDVLNDPDATESERNVAIATIAKNMAETPKNFMSSIKPLTEGSGYFNNLISGTINSLSEQNTKFTQKYGVSRSDLNKLNKYVYSVDTINSFSDTSSRNSLINLQSALQRYNKADAIMVSRNAAILSLQREIDKTDGLSYLDKIAHNKKYGKGENLLGNMRKLVQGQHGDGLSTLQRNLAQAGDELNKAFSDHIRHLNSARTNFNVEIVLARFEELNIGSTGGTRQVRSLKTIRGQIISNIDFNKIEIDIDHDFSALAGKKPLGGTEGFNGLTGGLGVIGYLAASGAAAYRLYETSSQDFSHLTSEQRNLKIASDTLILAGEVMNTISTVMDCISVFTKVSRFAGIAGVIIGAIGDVLKGVANAISVFADPNADDTDKALSIVNIFTPGMDLLSIKEAIELQNLLSDEDIPEAEKWALEGLYREATLNAIPVVNWFSFLWQNDKYKHAAQNIIAKYGDGNGQITDAGHNAFLSKALDDFIGGFYEDNFSNLKLELEKWAENGSIDQLINIGQDVGYESFSSRMQQIYNEVIPENIRNKAKKISKIVIDIGDQDIGDSELTIRNFGEVIAGQVKEGEYSGEILFRTKSLEWRLGREQGQSESIDANIGMVRIDQRFAGDSYIYDDLNIDNTVFYDSTGNRDYGYTKTKETVKETRWRTETYEYAGMGRAQTMHTGTRTVSYEVDVERYRHNPISGDNVDHIDLGGGKDIVVAGNIDEILKVTSNDWVDFQLPIIKSDSDDNIDNSAEEQSSKQNEPKMDDVFYATDVKAAKLKLRSDTAKGSHKFDLDMQKGQDGDLGRAQLENIETVIFDPINDDDNVSSLLYRDDEASFTVFASSELPLEIAGDGNLSGRFQYGNIMAGELDDNIFLNKIDVDNIAITSGNGDDRISMAGYDTAAQQVTVDGGFGHDTLVLDDNTEDSLVVIGHDHTNSNSILGGGIDGIFVNNIEEINAGIGKHHFMYSGGDVIINGGVGHDLYEVSLDQGDGVLEIMEQTHHNVDSVSERDDIVIDVEDFKDLDFRVNQKYESFTDYDSETIINYRNPNDKYAELYYKGVKRLSFKYSTYTADGVREYFNNVIIRYKDVDGNEQITKLDMSTLIGNYAAADFSTKQVSRRVKKDLSANEISNNSPMVIIDSVNLDLSDNEGASLIFGGMATQKLMTENDNRAEITFSDGYDQLILQPGYKVSDINIEELAFDMSRNRYSRRNNKHTIASKNGTRIITKDLDSIKFLDDSITIEHAKYNYFFNPSFSNPSDTALRRLEIDSGANFVVADQVDEIVIDNYINDCSASIFFSPNYDESKQVTVIRGLYKTGNPNDAILLSGRFSYQDASFSKNGSDLHITIKNKDGYNKTIILKSVLWNGQFINNLSNMEIIKIGDDQSLTGREILNIMAIDWEENFKPVGPMQLRDEAIINFGLYYNQIMQGFWFDNI